MSEKQPKVIKHGGRVIDVFEGGVDVSVISESACSSCKVKGACGMSEMKEKVVTVMTPYAKAYKIGDDVVVSIRRNMGMKAIFYVYLLPFLFVFGALVALTQSGLSQGIAGLLALVALGIYYLVMYLFRGRIDREINFEIEKSDNNQL